MATTPFDEVDEFCTGGDKTAFAPSKLVSGYTGSENDPAFAENINDILNQLTAANNQHAQITNDEIIPEVDKIPGIEAQTNRNSFPVLTAFPYLGDPLDLPSDWAVLDGSTFDELVYPLVYAALGNSNTLPDLTDERALIGTTGAALVLSNGTVIQHNHGTTGLSTDSAGSHTHVTTRGDISFWVDFPEGGDGTGTAGSGALNNNKAKIASAGDHTHPITGTIDNTGTPNGNIPKHATCHWILRLE